MSYTFYFYYSDKDDYSRSLHTYVHQNGIAHLFSWVNIHTVPKEKIAWLQTVPTIVASSPSAAQPNIYPREQVATVIQSIFAEHLKTKSQGQGISASSSAHTSTTSEAAASSGIPHQPGTNTTINPIIKQAPMQLYEQPSFAALPAQVSGRTTRVQAPRTADSYQAIQVAKTGVNPKDNRQFAVTNAPIMDQPRPEVTGAVLPFGDEWSNKYSGTYAFIDPNMPVPVYAFSAATGTTQEIVNDGVRKSFEAGKGTMTKTGGRGAHHAPDASYNPSVF
jgi:hypothetical protein